MITRRQRPIGAGDSRLSSHRRHGLSRADVEAMRDRQGGRCASCGDPLPPGTDQVDHDHLLAARHPHPVTEGCPRCVNALLCHHCNSMLAFARHDVRRLHAGVAYLRLVEAGRERRG